MPVKHVLLLSLGIFFIRLCFAQPTSSIKGKVLDANGNPLIGATVLVEGTSIVVATDLDGKFSIASVAAGSYNLTVKYISYNTKTISNVAVSSEKPANVNVIMESKAKEIGVIRIEAENSKKETIYAMQIVQKNSIRVSDNISAEAIRKTPDRSSGDVLKRVSGTTIQDNKFVIVRGLNDRYNAAYLNGAPLPSSESDRKAFSFDIFPAALLENIIVIKSATPDLPADFSGGIIQINTRNIPDEKIQSLSLSVGYNTLATFKKFYSYKGGKLDFAGMDDGTRELPSGIPATTEAKTYIPAQQAETAKLMSNNWAIKPLGLTPPALNLQYVFGNSYQMKNGQFGSILAITYNNNYKISRSFRREFEEQGDIAKPLQTFELVDDDYSNQVLGGLLWNFSYKLKQNNKFTFKNTYNINSEDKVILRNGNRINDGISEKSSVRWFTQNNFYSGQLAGEHFLPSTKLKVTWIGGYSDIKRNIPNLRRMVYTRSNTTDPSESLAPFEASVPSSGTSPTSGGNIFYAVNHEKIYSGSYDVSLPLDILPFSTNIKAGGFHQFRIRDFDARQLGFTRYNVSGGSIKFDKSLLLLPEEEIFSPENMGLIAEGKGGFKLQETTKLNDSYHATSTLHAAYAMMDNKFAEKLRLILGVRMESFNQGLGSYEDDGTPVKLDVTKVDFLPSANLIYSLNQKSNLRFSYAQTVSRPEFRELAPFGFFDFVTFFTVRGNPNLERALVHNTDLRYEIFPGNGQIFSFSIFYKRFTDAIEQVNRADVSRQLSYNNVPLVNNYGIELEYRLNLGSILHASPNSIFNHTYFFSNAALINSQVDVSKIPGSIDQQRPLQGQSPYIINGGLQYNNPDKDYSFSLSLNRVGRRIAVVGNLQEPHIYENPRTVMDMQLTKTFFKKVEVKLNVKDLFAQDLIFYQDINNNKKLDKQNDNLMSEINNGQTISIGISYKFN